MKTIVINIPDSVDLSEQEARMTLAASLYDQGKLSLEQAASITGFNPDAFLVMREEFEALNEPIDNYSFQDEIDRAWEIEIKKRLADIESGRATLIPGEEVHAKARKLLK
jgi:predicted HTH domain antitoxin